MKTYTVKQAFSPIVSYPGPNFQERFYPMSFDKKAKVKKLTSQKLPRAMTDAEIQKELNPGEVSIEEIVETLKTLDHSVWALFYCKDKDGVLRAVFVDWDRGGWRVDADSVAYPCAWNAGGQVFSRNSRDAKTPSDPLSLESLPKELTISGKSRNKK